MGRLMRSMIALPQQSRRSRRASRARRTAATKSAAPNASLPSCKAKSTARCSRRRGSRRWAPPSPRSSTISGTFFRARNLASDRLAKVDDPVVQRLTPRLVASLDRAVSLATNTLRYGRADEHPPSPAHHAARAHRRRSERSQLFAAKHPTRRLSSPTGSIRRSRSTPIPNSSIASCSISSAMPHRRLSDRPAARSPFPRGGPIARSRSTSKTTAPEFRTQCAIVSFSPFPVRARPGGSGLGLAIARDLARSHGGDVSLVSSVGERHGFPHHHSRSQGDLDGVGSQDLPCVRRRAHAARARTSCAHRKGKPATRRRSRLRTGQFDGPACGALAGRGTRRRRQLARDAGSRAQIAVSRALDGSRCRELESRLRRTM